MPIEIKELHIKAVISDPKTPCPDGLKKEDIDKLKKELTKSITEQVLSVIKQKNER